MRRRQGATGPPYCPRPPPRDRAPQGRWGQIHPLVQYLRLSWRADSPGGFEVLHGVLPGVSFPGLRQSSQAPHPPSPLSHPSGTHHAPGQEGAIKAFPLSSTYHMLTVVHPVRVSLDVIGLKAVIHHACGCVKFQSARSKEPREWRWSSIMHAAVLRYVSIPSMPAPKTPYPHTCSNWTLPGQGVAQCDVWGGGHLLCMQQFCCA